MNNPKNRGSLDESGSQLHSVGVRGAIDSGGYSASAEVKAQSALLSGVMDLQRRELTKFYTVETTLPCNLKPELLNAVKARPQDFAANHRAGEFYLQHAAPAEAVPYLETARRLNAADLEVARALAIADLETQEFANARDLLIRLLQSNDKNRGVRELLGVAEEGLGEFEAAEHQFRLAAESANQKENFFAWGVSLLLLGRDDRAGSVFKRAADQFGRSVALTIGRGVAFHDGGHSPEALDSFLRAAELDPHDPAPYMFIAAIVGNAANRDLAEVGKGLKRLVTISPSNAAAYYAYACTLWAKSGGTPDGRQSQEIEGLLNQAVGLHSTLAEAHFKLASLYAERGQYTLAIPEYRKAIEANPELIEAHYRLGQAYMRAGQLEMGKQELAQHQQLSTARKQIAGRADSTMRKLLLNRGQQALCPAVVQ